MKRLSPGSVLAPWRLALAFLVFLSGCTGLYAQGFQAGETIEYKVGGTYPEQGETGTIVRELPGGTQYLVREKPNQFYPQGFEKAYSPENLRRPAGAPGNTPDPIPNPAPQPTPGGTQALPDPKGAGNLGFGGGALPVQGEGLLSREDVLAYAKQVIGADPWAQPHRDQALNQIRDYIKTHGTNFKISATGDEFYDKLTAQSTNSVHIFQAIIDNYSNHPVLANYYGTWLLRAANRGSQSYTTDSAGRPVVLTKDSQHESGRLTINQDGTYVWETLRNDPSAQVIRGQWREAKSDEMMPTEGGPAIWLLSAKQGADYMARMDREVGYADWLDVGAGKGRTPVEYGRRQ